MIPSMISDTPLSMPIDGIPWMWRWLEPSDLQPLLPFVMAADPSGVEALNWPNDAVGWLNEQPCRRGLVGVQCLAGLTLALFFYALADEARGTRRLIVERLRWLELGRPHRSLDAALTILVDSARRLDCSALLIKTQAATERTARDALVARAEGAGFARDAAGWHQRL